ncbi:uncharacterized protein LOC126894026 isoform X2 [Daktulosphaira vitifoliae]|uniref:uncharacterized protein LOC126894026 isoform X2 n=1 Tax=Daktulosphaira vitifoliae TaxID=58002 RepID=UPI0021A9A3F7|nr:uncharacterized protein LOC126894026 isoform X2 [Daktulosphaira vitifoliae]
MTAVNNKMSPEIEHKLYESKHRFITLAEEIKSNVLIALSLPNYLQEYSTNYDYTKYKSIVDVYTKIEQNSETTLNEQKQFNSYSNFAFSNEDTIFEKSHLYNEFYHNFCKSLRAAIQDEVLVKMCKKRCNQKITKQAKDISEAINTFLELICNKINLNFSDERIRENELILKYKENEAFKVQINTIQQQIDEATEEYNKVSSDVTEKINYYKAQAESAVRSLKSKRTRFEMNYKNDMILYLKYFEKDLDELEAKLEAKKSQLKSSEVKNEIEIDHLKKEVKRWLGVKRILNN